MTGQIVCLLGFVAGFVCCAVFMHGANLKQLVFEMRMVRLREQHKLRVVRVLKDLLSGQPLAKDEREAILKEAEQLKRAERL